MMKSVEHQHQHQHHRRLPCRIDWNKNNVDVFCEIFEGALYVICFMLEAGPRQN
jgi:hypothetical protein